MVIATILTLHATEASFLGLLRTRAVSAPHYSLADLAKLDGRVEAHIDGLRIAGEAGWKFCEENLATNEEGEVFAAGVLAVESSDLTLIEKVLAVVTAEPKLAPALISAFGWPRFEQVQPHIQRLLQSEISIYQLIGLGATAVHRCHPGPLIWQAVRSEAAGLKARVLRAAGEFQDRSMERTIIEALGHADEDIRFAAAWSGAVLGFPTAFPVLRGIVESGSSHAIEAARLVARRMERSAALSWQKSLVGKPEHLRLAIIITGAVGDPAAVPWLISLMSQLPLARLAGEAFTTITGVGLDYRDLERKPPEDFNAGPTDDPSDENVDMDPDDNLPWPEPALVQKWWDKNKTAFSPGARYLIGKPIAAEWLKIVIRDGFQRHRAAAALELAFLNPGQPLFNVEAPGFRQIEMLGKPGPVIR